MSSIVGRSYVNTEELEEPDLEMAYPPQSYEQSNYRPSAAPRSSSGRGVVSESGGSAGFRPTFRNSQRDDDNNLVAGKPEKQVQIERFCFVIFFVVVPFILFVLIVGHVISTD